MENPLSNPASKPYKHKQLKKGAVRRVYKKHKKPKHGRLMSMVAIAVLLSSTGLIVVFAWISVQLIFNPYQMGWINKFLPEWAKISLDGKEHPYTLKQIQDSLNKQELVAGQILPLEGHTTEDFLLPVLKQRTHCQSNCRHIVELKVYQRSQDLELQSASDKHY